MSEHPAITELKKIVEGRVPNVLYNQICRHAMNVIDDLRKEVERLRKELDNEVNVKVHLTGYMPGEAERKLARLVEILDEAPELNLSNYDHDDVCELNAKITEAVLFARKESE